MTYDLTTYGFTLDSCNDEQYVYSRYDNYILVINEKTEYFLIKYFNINCPGQNIELFRGWLPNEQDFITVMSLVKP